MTVTQQIDPSNVVPTLQKHLIGDGFPLVFDFDKSRGAWIHDALSGEDFLDFYTFFASLPVGFQHPAFREPSARERLLRAALHKPANSDANSAEFASFVDAFARHAKPASMDHLFFIEGGALAVENALKTAFDWKVRRNIARGRGELGTKILHFRQAFHGRSGYTLSLTNTLPIKTAYFPKFDWPRVTNPKLRFPVDAAEEARVAAEEAATFAEIRAEFERHPHDIAAIIIEPIQGEGGDNHFRPEFFRGLRDIADEQEALLIFDEVQTGFGLTGSFWAFEQLGAEPDIVCFGKKAQVCGICAGPRIDEVEDNVFRVSSRLNSTWGGGLTDMVRCEIILDIMEREELVKNSGAMGARLTAGLSTIAERFPDRVDNVRGRGLFCAFDCRDAALRDALLQKALEHRLLVLACGERSIRFRPTLNIASAEIDEGLTRLERSLAELD